MVCIVIILLSLLCLFINFNLKHRGVWYVCIISTRSAYYGSALVRHLFIFLLSTAQVLKVCRSYNLFITGMFESYSFIKWHWNFTVISCGVADLPMYLFLVPKSDTKI